MVWWSANRVILATLRSQTMHLIVPPQLFIFKCIVLINKGKLAIGNRRTAVPLVYLPEESVKGSTIVFEGQRINIVLLQPQNPACKSYIKVNSYLYLSCSEVASSSVTPTPPAGQAPGHTLCLSSLGALLWFALPTITFHQFSFVVFRQSDYSRW